MSIKRSEEYLYLQNKARHYDKLLNIKPVISTRRHSLNASTIDGYHYFRPPHMSKYDILSTNEALVKGII